MLAGIVTDTTILPRAEVPCDLDIVPLPPAEVLIQQFFNVY